MLRRATFITGGTGKDACGCRRTWGICDAPVGCMGWSYDDKPPRGMPEDEKRREERMKRAITLERALELLDIAEEWGQVNVPANISGDTATFWVKIDDDLSSTDATIYVYYGNTQATSASNGTATFVFFDDFEDADLSEWDYTNSWEVQSSIELGFVSI